MRVVFDRFAFDSDRRELHHGQETVHLGPKAFRLLEILIANSPRALSKQELYESIWQDTVVDESNLAGLINEVRTALGDKPKTPKYIRTVHGFGYAFCCDVKGEGAPVHAGFVVFRGREIPLREGVNVLGRDASADIQIDDATVSRKHAAIEIRADGAILEDLASKNGTFLDGDKLAAPVPIREGQTIVLGDAAIVFRRSRGRGSTITIQRMKDEG
jgi:DNA-binding winged helix-turn-helix (wHTH) protein